MEAQELMVGDLVYLDNHLARVKGVTIPFVLVHTEERGYFALPSRISPIPLTEEILRRNFTENNKVFGWYDDYFDFSIWEINDGSFLVRHHSCEMNLPYEQIIICFVHQLQHFISHCAIDKGIQL